MQAVWAHSNTLFPPYVQCCAAEFLTYVLDRLTTELGDGGRVVHDLFAAEVLNSMRCHGCGPPAGGLEARARAPFFLGARRRGCDTTLTRPRALLAALSGRVSSERERAHGLSISLPADEAAEVSLVDALDAQFSDEVIQGYACEVRSLVDRPHDLWAVPGACALLLLLLLLLLLTRPCDAPARSRAASGARRRAARRPSRCRRCCCSRSSGPR